MKKGASATFGPQTALGRFLGKDGPGRTRLHFAPTQVICSQGKAPSFVFYIEDGHIELSAVSPNGKRAVIGVRTAGSLFGLRAIGDSNESSVTAIALTDCTIWRISPVCLNQQVQIDSAFAAALIAIVVRQLVQDQQNLIEQLTSPAERRLVRVLLQLVVADRGSKQPGEPLRLNHNILADMIGTTRPRVSSFMSKLRRAGLIDYDRRGIVRVDPALESALPEER